MKSIEFFESPIFERDSFKNKNIGSDQIIYSVNNSGTIYMNVI